MIYFPLYAKSLDIPDVNIGLIFTLFNVISLIIMLLFGILTDYLGSRKIIVVGAIGILLWLAGIAFFDSFLFFLIAYFFGGIGSVLFLISLNTAFYSALDEQSNTTYITLFYICATLGFMVGPFTAGILTKYFEYPQVFKFDILIILLIFIFIYKSQLPQKVQFKISDYLQDIKNLKVILFILITAIFYSHYGVEQTSYTLLMKNNIKLTDVQIGNIFIILGFWIAAVTLIIGKILKTKYLVLAYAFGLILCGVFQFLTGYSEQFYSFIICRLLHTFGDAVCTLMLGILVTFVFNKNRLGFSFGFFLMAQLAASIPFSYISGILSKKNDYSMPFYFNGIFIILLAFVILIFRKKLRLIFGLEKNKTR